MIQSFDEFEEMFENKKESPYSQEVLDKYKKKWEKGEKIPFGIEGTLKAQGLIPRADGTYKISDKYKTPSRISALKIFTDKKKKVKSSSPKKGEKSFLDKIGPETKKPESHSEKVTKRIEREEKKKLRSIEKPGRIEKHPDFKHKGNPVDKDFEGMQKKTIIGKKQESIPVKKVNKKSFAGNDINKKTFDVKPVVKKKWSSKTKISESFLDFEEFSLYESLTYSGGDVTKMPVIGKIFTKPIGPFESTDYEIVEIVEDERGVKYYICNFWYKNRIPQIVHEDMVEKFEKANEKI